MGLISNLFGKKKTPDERFTEAVQEDMKGNKQVALKTYLELINEKHMDGDYHLPYQRAVYILEERKQWSKIIELCDLYEKRYHPWGHDHWHHAYKGTAQRELVKLKQTDQPKQPVQQTSQPKQEQQIQSKQEKIVKEGPKQVPLKPIQPKPSPRNPYPTQANWKLECSTKDNYATTMAQIIALLPEFDCYANGKQPEYYPQDAAFMLRDLKNKAFNKLLDAEEVEEQRNFIKAAEIYEEMVTLKYWDEEPYEKLFQIYYKSHLKEECIKLSGYVFRYFESIQNGEKEKVLQLATKYGCLPQYQKMIEQGQEVVYYMGLYKLYSPRPWIQKWKDRWYSRSTIV